MHIFMPVHSLSDVAFGAAISYWSGVQTVVVMQVRSLVLVGFCAWYCADEHSTHGWHALL